MGLHSTGYQIQIGTTMYSNSSILCLKIVRIGNTLWHTKLAPTLPSYLPSLDDVAIPDGSLEILGLGRSHPFSFAFKCMKKLARLANPASPILPTWSGCIHAATGPEPTSFVVGNLARAMHTGQATIMLGANI
jgi:hypothetical protein